ncbi:MAG: hypothetical protein HRT92_09530 [Piscirickettsiaceae bacterium]|nr:hypothetical protein [Piscirickettsiaceae bacterium]
MEIIPVIDLMGGIVVHARGGERQSYLPLQSVLTDHVEPIKVIADLLAFYSFKTLYLADLDAITDQTLNIELYRQIIKVFPQISFLLDVGIQTQQQWEVLNKLSGLTVVIASESLSEIELLQIAQDGILSLDFQHGVFLGNNEILEQAEHWPDTIIMMNLDAVGAQTGPDISLLKQLRTQREGVNIIVAGGVRNVQDLMCLKQESVTKVLIASALHNGMLDSESIQMVQK